MVSTIRLSPKLQAARDAYIEQIIKLIDDAFYARSELENIPDESFSLSTDEQLMANPEQVTEEEAVAALIKTHLEQWDDWVRTLEPLRGELIKEAQGLNEALCKIAHEMQGDLIKSGTWYLNQRRNLAIAREEDLVRDLYEEPAELPTLPPGVAKILASVISSLPPTTDDQCFGEPTPELTAIIEQAAAWREANPDELGPLAGLDVPPSPEDVKPEQLASILSR